MCLNGWGGGNTNGTPVKLYDKSVEADNSLWEIVATGGDSSNPEKGDLQYHILAGNCGLMLCGPADGSADNVTLATRIVKDPSTRWKIIAVGDGSYNFACVAGSNMYLNVRGAGTTSGTDLMIYSGYPTAPNVQFKFKLPTS